MLTDTNQKCITLLAIILVLLQINPSHAQVHDYETTRLKSTAGAGVGSLLLTESAILNPASLSYFNLSAFYLQRYSSEYTGNTNGLRPDQTTQFNDSDSYALVISDTSRSLKGSISLQKLTEGSNKRERATASMGYPVGKRSSIGINYRYTKDIIDPSGFSARQEKYQQVSFGATHVPTPDLSLGVVVVDPLEEIPQDTKVVAGVQYVISSIVALMGDIGANYTEDPSDTLLYRIGLQVNFFTDLYLRAGIFNDKGLREKGNGIGLAWIGPKLEFDIAFKNNKPIGNPDESPLINAEYRETSLALSYRF